ncbi:MAG: hypothetical protein KJ623_04760 [Nanoarchaeota archaeon]|nr:hypothetical protein [Nanoarchaeota archaeon]MBU0963339.1 hypothetical protein [Nanoarchaeota archaeon]
MKTQEMLNKISGIQTIESIKSALKINKRKAIYLIHSLRKKGYITTKQGPNHIRIYNISIENALGGVSYIDIINKYSPVKLSSSEVYKIYGREVSIEETIIFALKTRKLRYIIASLALFRRIKDWNEIYRLAKKNNLIREVGALYDLVQVIIPRVKKMPKFYLHYSLPKKASEFLYIIPHLKSRDYSLIENKWRIHIPFNKNDLEEYNYDINK